MTAPTPNLRAAADVCASNIPVHFHKQWPCDCWKADALG